MTEPAPIPTRVLLAEDSSAAQRIILNALQGEGYSVECYRDGLEAFQAILRPDSPDLIILDWAMPGMNGLEICEKVVQTGLNEEKYIIILSATSDKQSIARILHAGANDYVTKPMNREELLARMKVAQRQLDLIHELRAKTEELRSYIRKHRMLRQFTGSGAPGSEDSRSANLPLTGQITDTKAAPMRAALSLPAVRHFEKAFLKVLEQFKLGGALSEAKALEEADLDARRHKLFSWACLYLPNLELWLDLILETTHGAAEDIARHALRKNIPVESEVIDLFSEIVTLGLDALKKQITETGNDVETPFSSYALLLGNRAALMGNLPHWITWQMHIIDGPARLHLLPSIGKVETVDAGSLQPGFLLMKDITPPGPVDNVLMPRLSVINPQNLKTIHRWASFNAISRDFAILRPSTIGQRFLALRAKRSVA